MSAPEPGCTHAHPVADAYRCGCCREQRIRLRAAREALELAKAEVNDAYQAMDRAQQGHHAALRAGERP